MIVFASFNRHLALCLRVGAVGPQSSVNLRPRCYAYPALMKVLHYACLVEAGDVLYEAGETTLNREIAQAVATHSNQNESRRSFVFEGCAITYQLDMAIVFVVVSTADADTKLVFATLQEMKRRWRDPDRPLHFEESLAELLDDYNVDLEKDKDEDAQKIKREMAKMPEIEQESLEAIVPTETLDDLRSSATLIDLDASPSQHSHSFVPKQGSRVITAVIACACLSITLVIILIIWGYNSSPSSDKTTTATSTTLPVSSVPSPILPST